MVLANSSTQQLQHQGDLQQARREEHLERFYTLKYMDTHYHLKQGCAETP